MQENDLRTGGARRAGRFGGNPGADRAGDRAAAGDRRQGGARRMARRARNHRLPAGERTGAGEGGDPRFSEIRPGSPVRRGDRFGRQHENPEPGRRL
ncbi:hypothetical protein FYJ85_12370 [Victivallaceae bacterium BBE-744-WT-12]|uniref:Uncharacterized protein n=1 Tax=Victivallis lenta TaxID=2606640 RepID=A0A844G4J4_9BACT|nr:hypothetical protein [Victivallis lenta]HBP05710.1 hypothetical protein [Lentisphaeria bacterium]